MRLVFLIIILAISLGLIGQGVSAPQRTRIKRLDGSMISSSEIERTVTRLMREGHVTGLGLAILNDNKVVYIKSFGFRDKEQQKPLTENTVMYGASFHQSGVRLPGLSWGLFRTPYGKAYFKEGHDDGWENHSVVFPDKKIAIVLMANSSNGDSIFKELLETLIEDKFTPWKWEGYVPYNL
jgi:CubicO group peptidase (beta-lactamase class C family)